MKHLNVAWSQISDKQLCELMQVILEQQKNAELSALNLSYNALNMKDPFSQKFLQLLIEFIQHSDTLAHLDLSGMQIGDSALDLINGIK
jgi:Ran GTPase-activating protein (RanGAP) involved in mRNA processing and transport